jgi:acyl carrier protein
MTKDELHNELQPVIGDAERFGDGLWDSLGHVQVMCILEKNHGMEITEERIGRLTSLEAILREINHA